eukprot:5323619-Pyramimonas_sp.AAC.1
MTRIPRSNDIQAAFNRAAEEHRLRREWVHMADFVSDPSDNAYIEEINEHLHPDAGSFNDLTALYQPPNSVKTHRWRTRA